MPSLEDFRRRKTTPIKQEIKKEVPIKQENRNKGYFEKVGEGFGEMGKTLSSQISSGLKEFNTNTKSIFDYAIDYGKEYIKNKTSLGWAIKPLEDVSKSPITKAVIKSIPLPNVSMPSKQTKIGIGIGNNAINNSVSAIISPIISPTIQDLDKTYKDDSSIMGSVYRGVKAGLGVVEEVGKLTGDLLASEIKNSAIRQGFGSATLAGVSIPVGGYIASKTGKIVGDSYNKIFKSNEKVKEKYGEITSNDIATNTERNITYNDPEIDYDKETISQVDNIDDAINNSLNKISDITTSKRKSAISQILDSRSKGELDNNKLIKILDDNDLVDEKEAYIRQVESTKQIEYGAITPRKINIEVNKIKGDVTIKKGDTIGIHGTKEDFDSFDIEKSDGINTYGKALYTSSIDGIHKQYGPIKKDVVAQDDLKIAYKDYYDDIYNSSLKDVGGDVEQAKIKTKNILIEQGYDGVHSNKETAIWNVDKTKIENNIEGDVDIISNIITNKDELSLKIKDSIDNLSNRDTAAYDLGVYTKQAIEKYNLPHLNELHSNLFKTSGEINSDVLNKLLEGIKSGRDEFYFPTKSLLNREIDNLSTLLGIEEKIVNKAFGAGVKEGKKISKEKLETKLKEVNSKHQEKITKTKTFYQDKIAKLETKYKETKGKIKDDYRIKLEAVKKIYKDKIDGINKKHKVKVEELKSTATFKNKFYNTFFNKLRTLEKSPDFYGKIDLLSIKKGFGKVKDVESAKKYFGEVLARITISQNKGLMKKVKKELKDLDVFKKSIDKTKRVKMDMDVVQTFLKTGDLLRLAKDGAIDNNDLLKLLYEIKIVKQQAEAKMNILKTAKSNLAYSFASKIEKDLGGKEMTIFGETDFGDSPKFFKKLKLTLSSPLNYILYHAHFVEIAGRGNQLFKDIFYSAPLKGMHIFQEKLDQAKRILLESNNKIVAEGKKIGYSEDGISKALGTYWFAIRKSKGEYVGINKLIGMVEHGRKNNYVKRYENTYEKPDILSDLDDDLWAKIANTQFAKDITTVANNDILTSEQAILNSTIREYAEIMKVVAKNEDNINIEFDDNYVKYKTNGQNFINRDVDGNEVPYQSSDDYYIDMTKGNYASNINDGFTRGLTNSTKYNYELDYRKLFLHSAYELNYYSAMRKTYGDMKDVFTNLQAKQILSKKVEDRLKEFIDTAAKGGVVASKLDKQISGITGMMSGLVLSFKLGAVLKQMLSFLDMSVKVGLIDTIKSISSVGPKELKKIYTKSVAVRNRAGGTDVSRFLKDMDNNVFDNKISEGLSSYIKVGNAPLTHTDRYVASVVWHNSYINYLKGKGIPFDGEYNNYSAIMQADADMTEIMSTGDDLFKSPIMRTSGGKIILALTGAMQNSFGLKLAHYKNNKTMFARARVVAYITAIGLTEKYITQLVATMYYEMGLGSDYIIQLLEEEEFQDKAMKGFINQIPVVGNIFTVMETPEFGTPPLISVPASVLEGISMIGTENKKGEDKTIDGFEKILRSIGLGDLGRTVRYLAE